MPSCPICSEKVPLKRWLRTCGQGMNLHTRCNQCHTKISVFIPWYVSIPTFVGPIASILIWSNFIGNVPSILTVFAIIFQFASIPLGYLLFGKVSKDE